MVSLAIILIGAGLLGASGLIALLVPGSGARRDRVAAALMGLGGLLGSGAALRALTAGVEAGLRLEWGLPWGRFALRLDALASAFLLPVFIVPALGAVYGTAYWPEGRGAGARSLRVFYGILAGSMALVVLARDGVLLLIVWEVMALAAFFALGAEDRRPAVRRAAWVYLIATHVGSLALMASLALLAAGTGGFDLAPPGPGVPPPASATGVFLLALVGFGLKAGLMPLHVWLPAAHANAPSHVSAVLSGVMLKMGVYGLARVAWTVPGIPAWCGWLVVGLGAASAVLGIALANAQHDYKRLLAYSSIENIGIVAMALGAGLVGRATGDPILAALGLAGAVLHVWNHALFKPLLFFVAGAVLHGTGTRRMNLLGGLARTMPLTAAAACLGCVAIGALPPLNGFVGEWVIYRALVQGAMGSARGPGAGFAGAAAALALTGALALVAFVRLFGTVFLGMARSPAPDAAHDAPRAMLIPMGVLALLCAALGALPVLVVPCVSPVVRLFAGPDAHGALAPGLLRPLSSIGAVSVVLLAVSAVGVAWLRRRARARTAPRPGTWDCGYARPSARMQYGESSLGQMVVALLGWALLVRRRAPSIGAPFPGAASVRTDTPDPVLDRVARPGLRGLTRLVLRLRLLQRGQVQIYMLYILLVVIVLLALEGF